MNSTRSAMERRIGRLDWSRIRQDLDTQGWAIVRRLLGAAECRQLVSAYDRDDRYRATIDMERYRFGRGQYRYFGYPLPPLVEALRQALYSRLQPIANTWTRQLRRQAVYPPTLREFVALCHAAGQTRPTPLLLRYHGGDYNCLHQDVYGEIGFPLQLSVVLSQRGAEYEGGEVILLEQRPRAQSKAVALTLERGDGLIFTNRERPVQGSRGWYAVQMRHGISPLTRGQRFVLGVIFHDAA